MYGFPKDNYFCFQFDEPYNVFLMGCKCFDFLDDGFVSRIDFRQVLREFGLPTSAIDLEYFLSRSVLVLFYSLLASISWKIICYYISHI